MPQIFRLIANFRAFGKISKSMAQIIGLMFCVIGAVEVSLGQDYQSQTGSPVFSVMQPVPYGVVNLANGNLHVEIPLASAPQRGSLKFVAKLVYDSRIWHIVKIGGTFIWKPTNIPNSFGGWRFATSADTGSVTFDNTQLTGGCNGGNTVNNVSFAWTSPDGTIRKFPVATAQDPGCPDDIPSADGYAVDSSGYHMFVTNYTNVVVYARDGTQVFPRMEDPNGNYFSTDSNGNVVDTLGRTVVKQSTSGNQIFYDVLNSQGTTSRITVTTKSIFVGTFFAPQVPGVSDDQENITVLDTVKLPSGDVYSFSYDNAVLVNSSTGAYTAGYGLLSGISPGGSYSFENFVDSFGIVNRWATNTIDATISYKAGGTNPASNQATLTRNGGTETFTFTLNNGAWLTDVTTSTGTEMVKTYDFSQKCPGNPSPNLVFPFCSGPVYIRLIKTVNSDGGGTHQTTYSYDNPQFGNVTLIQHWNYYAGGINAAPPATPDHQTVISMNPVIGANILNRVHSATLEDGSGTVLSQTSYVYDGTPLVGLNQAIINNDTSVGTARGNLTQVSQSAGSSTLTTNLTYDTTGQVVSVKDTAGNLTKFDYSDKFYNDAGSGQTFGSPNANPSTATNAYPTTITFPVGKIQIGYYFGSGKQAYLLDENTQQTAEHYIDTLDRLTQVVAPKGWQQTSYNSLFSYDVFTGLTDTQPSTTCTSCVHFTNTLDLQGRVVGSTVQSDPDGAVTTTVSYDITGNVLTANNPTRSGTGAATTNSYDVMYRLTQVQNPDNSVAQLFYDSAVTGAGGAGKQLCASATYGLGAPMLGINEVGNMHQIWRNAFGQTIEADEPDATNTLSVATCYLYNAAGELTQVSQGNLTRSYQYDPLGRITQATTPEGGKETFAYVNDDGTLCSGSPAGVCKHVDARGIATRYKYDADGRLTQKTYSDGTPTAVFNYGESSALGVSLTNTIGRLSSMYTQNGTGTMITGEVFSYDATGNIIDNSQCTPQNCATGVFHNTYTTDQVGNITGFNNSWGRNLSATLNNAAEPTALTVSPADSTHPAAVLSNAKYNAFGEMTVASLGDGLDQAMDYSDARGWLQSIRVGKLKPLNQGGGNAAVAGQITLNLQGQLKQSQAGTPANISFAFSGVDRSTSNGTGSGTPGTGTVIVNGVEQVKQVMEIPATGGTGSVTISGAQQMLSPAATGSSLTSFVGAGNAQYAAYLDSSQHINAVIFTSGSTWQWQDLTALSGGATPATNSRLARRVAGFVYQSADQHIHQVWWWSDQSRWVDNDMTLAGGATVAARSGTPLAAWSDSLGIHLVYIGQDNHIYDSFYNGANSTLDLTSLAGGSGAAANSSLTNNITSGGIVYQSPDGHIHQVWYWSANTRWVDNDMTLAGGATVAARSGTPLAAWSDSLGIHEVYFGQDNHIYDSFYNGANSTLDLTSLAGGPGAAANSNLTANFSSGGIVYQSPDGHIHQVWYWSANSRWVDNDMTIASGTSAVAGNGTPVLAFSGAGGIHEMFLDQNSHVYDLYYNGSTGNLTSQDVTPPARLDAGTVSLTVGSYTAKASYGITQIPGSRSWAQSQDITSLSGAASSGAPVSFAGSAAFPLHVFYSGTNGHVHEQYSDSNGGWHDQDNSAGSGATSTGACVSSGFFSSGATPEHVFYGDQSWNIHEQYSDSSGSWHDQNITAAAGAPNAQCGAQGYMVAGSLKHVFYSANNGVAHIHELYSDSTGAWHDQDLTALSGSAATTAGNPQIAFYSQNSSTPEHVFYLDFTTNQSSYHIHEIYSDSSSQWHDHDITSLAGAPTTGLNNTALSGFLDSSGSEHVFYTGSDSKIHHLWSNAAGWSDENVSAQTGPPGYCYQAGPSAASQIVSYIDAAGSRHVYFNWNVSTLDICHFWSDSAGWHTEDISILTGNRAYGVRTGFYDGVAPHIFAGVGTSDTLHLTTVAGPPTTIQVNPTAAAIASALVNDPNTGLNVFASPVDATLTSSTTIQLKARQGGANSNYSLAISSTFDNTDFTSGSYSGSPSGPALVGGTDGIFTPLYDSGSFKVTVNGHPDEVVWGEGDTPQSIAATLANKINLDPEASVTATVPASLPSAAPGSSVSSYQSSPGVNHIVYEGSNGHLYDVSWDSTNDIWSYVDVTVAAGAPVAAAGSPLPFFLDIYNLPHWTYAGTDQNVYLIYLNSTGYHYVNLNSWSGGSPIATNGSALTASFQSSDYGQIWSYLGGNQHIYMMYNYSGSSGPAYADVTAAAGAPLPAAGSPLTFFLDIYNDPHWTYVGSDQNVYLIYNTSPTSGTLAGNWHYVNLNSWSGGSPSAVQGSALTSSFQSSDYGQIWSYIGGNQHIYMMYNYSGSSGPAFTDVTVAAGAPLPASGSPLSFFLDIYNDPHWAYLGTDQNVYLIYNTNPTSGTLTGNWHYVNLNSWSGGSPVAGTGSPLNVYFQSSDYGQFWSYMGANQHVYEMFNYSGSPGPAYLDMTAAAAAAVPANVVTLTAKLAGSKTNYAYSAQFTNNDVDFPQASFNFQPNTPPLTLQGGADGSGTVSDTGTITVTVNGFTKTIPYGPNDWGITPSGGGDSLTPKIAAAFNADPNSPVWGTFSGLVAKTPGPGSDYPISIVCQSNNSNFTGTSFLVSATPSNTSTFTSALNTTLTGGSNNGVVFFDNGVFSLTVGPYKTSVAYGQLDPTFLPLNPPSTASQIVAALANNINQAPGSPVIAAASGSQLSLIAKNGGAGTNYPYSSSIVSNDPAYPSGSFSFDHPSSALAGGSDKPNSSTASSSIAAVVFNLTGNPTWSGMTSATFQLTVNGQSYSANIGQTPLVPANIAASLAQTINTTPNTPVTATASGNELFLQSVNSGSTANYPVIASPLPPIPNSSAQIPLAVVVSGGTMTNGTDGSSGSNSGNIYALDLNTDVSGTVFSAFDSVNGNWSYQYDNLGRLQQASTSSNTYNYDYDIYGNRLHQTPTNGGNSLALVYVNNQISVTGITYDASGNMTSDGTHTYAYDAENRLISVDGGQTASYVYSAASQRVRSTVGSNFSDFIHDLSGTTVGVLGANGALVRQEIGDLATYNSAGAYFHHRDALGNLRAVTDQTGAIQGTCTNLPYGDALTCTTAITPLKFTSYMRDSETNLDFANARYYTSQFGRFMSPDPVGGSRGNPQSLNRYAYVLNSPLTATDSSGMSIDSPSDGWSNPTINTVLIYSGATDTISSGGVWFSAGPFNFAIANLGGSGPGSPGGGTLLSCFVFAGCGGAFDKGPPPPSAGQLTAEADLGGLRGSLSGGSQVPDPSDSYESYLQNWNMYHKGEEPLTRMGYELIYGNKKLWQQSSMTVNIIGGATLLTPVFVAGVGEIGATIVAADGIEMMEVAVGAGRPFHIAFRAGEAWMHANGRFFAMKIMTRGAEEWVEKYAWFRFAVPILSSTAVRATLGTAASSCLTGFCYAVWKGWLH